jgi:hypothetical protein
MVYQIDVTITSGMTFSITTPNVVYLPEVEERLRQEVESLSPVEGEVQLKMTLQSDGKEEYSDYGFLDGQLLPIDEYYETLQRKKEPIQLSLFPEE